MRILLVILVGAGLGLGQSTDAVLTGTVLDPSDARIVNARVTALNVKTGVSATTATNEAGVYLFPALQPGAYHLTVEHSGFRKLVYSDVELEIGARQSLNLHMGIGATSEAVEVSAATETGLGYLTSSVGNVITARKVLDLPLESRNVYELLSTQAGVSGPNGGQNFNGARVGSLNFTLDGTNVQDNLLNSLFLAGVAANISVDRVEEFRVITSPADAELGRGSGQLQSISRSGTNQFHGSVFEQHRNTVLTANTWFNNQLGVPRNFLIRNQYGGRLGGPIRRNHTFFHFNYEGQKERLHQAITRTVYTATARQGLWRFFPGAQNGNANAAAPTVDLNGNPVRPSSATDNLQTVSVFGRDPNRPAADSSGIIAKQLSLMPLPNNFRAGDGLNTAGFTWSRSRPFNVKQFDIRLDHQLTSNHRLSFSYSHQSAVSFNFIGTQNYPGVPPGGSPNNADIFSLSAVSVLRPTLLNEFHAGVFRPRQTYLAPWQVGGTDVLPQAGGQPYLLSFSSVNSPLFPAVGDDPSDRISPVYQYSDSLTWSHGRHSFKGGAEVRFVSSAGYDTFNVMARTSLGAGAVSVQNINNIPGIGVNLGAGQLLSELAGSLNGATQTFNSPGGANPAFLPGQTRYRNWRQHEFDWFFKDDFKVTPSLTLNLGVRYEWYAVPYDSGGRGLALAGGSASIFGISGASFADLFQPGRTSGALTRVQPVGLGTANPGIQLYENDNNNFAPAAGLSWALPWFGKDKTVFRAGYGMGFERNPIFLAQTVSALEPGFSQTFTFVSPSLLTVSNLKLPLTPVGQPLSVVPLTDRTQTVYSFDDHLRTPYYQNWNAALQRSLNRDTFLSVRYVGNKGTRLIRDANINEVNIFENGILDAFRITQAGGNSPLLDRIFLGLNIPGLGVVDGVKITGSDAVRGSNSFTTTQGFLAGNNVGGFANYLNNTNQFTGVNGGLLRRVGLPENWVVANPQFGGAMLTSNFGSSTYHALQVEVMKRFSGGWTLQSNYTWSKALGDYEGDGSALGSNFRTLRSFRADKKVLSFGRSHAWKSNGIWELPFGPGKTWGRGSKGWRARLIENWQVGSIYTVSSGQPINLDAVGAFNTFGNNTPVAVAPFSKGAGEVQRGGNGVVYFSGFQQIPDPWIANITTLQSLRGRSTMRAITDSAGRLLLVNPAPGQLGTLAPRFLEGPGYFRLDANLIKRIRIREGKDLQLRADIINATNSPQFANPDTNINSTTFGRITDAGGNRIIVVGARFTF